MDEDSSQNNKPKDLTFSFINKKLMLGAIAFFIVILGIAAFLLGRQSKSALSGLQSQTPSETPLPSPEPTKIASTPIPRRISPTPTPLAKTKIYSSVSALDGFQSSNGEGNNNLEIRVGRNTGSVTRGFVSFNLSEIASADSVDEATLRLYQVKIDGHPYSPGGTVKVDHLTYGDSLDDTDYGMAALISSITALNPSGDLLGWKEADVTRTVKDDYANGRSKSQFRIHFTTENTGGTDKGDFVYFEAAENTQKSGNTPQLVIKYH